MAVSVFERPGVLTWTNNPFYWRFYFAFMPVNSRLDVKVLDRGGITIITLNYPLTPATGAAYGTVDVYLNDILKVCTRYNRPGYLTGVNTSICEEALGAVFPYKINWAAISPGVTPAYTVEPEQKVARGGVGDMTFTGELAINQYSGNTPASFRPTDSGFLTWVPSGRMMRKEEYGWLTFLCIDSSIPVVIYTVNYADGSTGSFSRNVENWTPPFTHRCWNIPVGIDQAQLDPASKGVLSYNIQVVKYPVTAIPTALASYDINVDVLPRYNAMTLYYRNSLGGWDNISINGAIDRSADAERNEADQFRPTAGNGASIVYSATTTLKWAGLTGYLTKQHCAALVELIGNTESAILYNGQWLPVKVTSKTLPYHSTKNDLHSIPIEFESAGSFNSLPKQLLGLI